MEIVIPLFALSSMYIINGQSKNKNNRKEGFKASQLPNIDIPNINYPAEIPISSSESLETSILSSTNRLDNGGGEVYTDKYFKTEIPVNPNIKYQSITGEQVDASYFKHSNMVPFFGSKITGATPDANMTESILDNYSGAGSQIFTKKEQAPLFAPLNSVQWSNGMPNQSEFIRSRINPSMKMNNVNPFAEESVAPGLDLGYSNDGAGGYNAGMMAREKWLDKSVDELRAANKPRSSGHMLYGFEGPATSRIQNVISQDQIGRVDKHLPEKSFALGRDRLFTTTGVQKGQTLQPIEIDRYVSRPETSVEYTGVAGSSIDAPYEPGEFRPSTNQALDSFPLGVANANGRQYANDGEYEIRAKTAYPNNRTVNKQDDYFGNMGGSIGATVAPILDMLRPSRKENVIGTLRPYQNPGSRVSDSYVYNPNDRPAATIREMTEQTKHGMGVNANQHGGAYKTTEKQLKNTMRQDTSDYYYAGAASSAHDRPTSYENNYNQRNNDIKSSTVHESMVQGNMSLLNNNINMRQDNRDQRILQNNRAMAPTLPYQTPDFTQMGTKTGAHNALYSGIQLDRNQGDILSALKGNPYIMSYPNPIRSA